MRGQRVLVSGMGGELGSLVASLLETEPWVGSILGVDVDPPRRRLRRSEFHLIEPSDRQRIVDVVTRFDPHVLVHLAVWEPDARAGTTVAKRLTSQAATSVLAAAAECRSLEAIVVRSGIEIYGRGRGALTRPDEDSPTHPTSEYGRMVADLEASAFGVGNVLAWPSVPSAWRRYSDRTCPARSGECFGNRSCRSACWPIPRSRWCSIRTRRWPSSPQPSNDRKVR